MSDPEILIIDDEPQIRKLLKITLQANGYRIAEAATAKEGITAAANHPPELILLDLGLPDESGHVLLKKLREWYQKPIVILSVQDDEQSIITALDNGANDYLVKPFRTGELLARIRSVLRDTINEQQNPVISCSDLEIDFAAMQIKKNGEAVYLTLTEFSLLSLLAKNQGRVLTHHYLLKNIWGPSYINESQYLRVFIAQLRRKIEIDPNHPQHIITQSGVGYRFL
jgi:two-component system KDP operon response regulator KdpE